MHDHELDRLRELVAVQAQTLTLQSETLKRMEVIMSAQSDVFNTALDAFAAKAHEAAGEIATLKADNASKDASIADLTQKLSDAQANTVDPAFFDAATAKANASAAELDAAMNPPAPAPEQPAEPQPEQPAEPAQ